MNGLYSEIDIKDFVEGCVFWGTGGGGDPALGERVLQGQLKERGKIEWMSANEIENDSMTSCPFLMGSMLVDEKEMLDIMDSVGLEKNQKMGYLACIKKAVRALEAYKQTQIRALIPGEIGGSNAPIVLAAGSSMGIPVVDGDYSGGRALPAMDMNQMSITGGNVVPVAAADLFGSVVVIDQVRTMKMLERIGKHLSIAGGGATGNAAYLSRLSDSRKGLTEGTLTKALLIGRKIREAREKEQNLETLINKITPCSLIWEGEIKEVLTENRGGYYWGKCMVNGSGPFEGKNAELLFQNEIHLMIVKEEPEWWISSPDLITVMDMKTMRPCVTPELDAGKWIQVYGMPSTVFFRGERALEKLSPKALGINLEYVPIEKVIKAHL